jgi:hypothetical protein
MNELLEKQIKFADKIGNEQLRRIACLCTWGTNGLDVKPLVTDTDRREHDMMLDYYMNLQR